MLLGTQQICNSLLLKVLFCSYRGVMLGVRVILLLACLVLMSWIMLTADLALRMLFFVSLHHHCVITERCQGWSMWSVLFSYWNKEGRIRWPFKKSFGCIQQFLFHCKGYSIIHSNTLHCNGLAVWKWGSVTFCCISKYNTLKASCERLSEHVCHYGHFYMIIMLPCSVCYIQLSNTNAEHRLDD